MQHSLSPFSNSYPPKKTVASELRVAVSVADANPWACLGTVSDSAVWSVLEVTLPI